MSHGTDIKELLQLPRHVRECPEVVTAIREIIEQDDEALQYYVRWMRFESLLRWTLQQTSLEQHLVVTEIRREHRRANWIRAAIVAFTLIAALTTVYGIAMLRDSLDPPVLPLVRTAGEWETSNPVIWENQDHPPSQIIQTGDRLSATHGSFLLRLKSGVTISCTAPIDLEVIDDWELFLHSGKAYAWVQPGGRGFRIRSPSVKIVDLGTVFGMTVNPDGSTEVQVIEGSVQAQSEKFEPQIIQGGTAYHVSSTGNLSLPRTVSSMEVKEQLSTLVGIQSLSGNLELRLSPPSSTLPHDLITRDGGCLFREQASIASNEEIELSTATPGRYSHKEPPARYQLPAGTRVSTYLIHASRPQEGPAVATIRFDSEILGFALSGRQLDSTDAVFGHADVIYPSQSENNQAYRGRGSVINEDFDIVEVSSDRHTLHVQLGNSSTSFDQIRVFVAAKSETKTVPP